MFRDNEAFSGFSVDDIDRARTFYGKTLGLKVETNAMGYLEMTLGSGTKVFVYPKPNHEPATYTMLNIVVPDIERAVDDLAAAGVGTEHYDMPDLRTDAKGIARDERGPAMAWVKDPAGNIIGIMEGRAEP